MQQPLPTTLPPESENRFPDCLSMKLAGTPVETDNSSESVVITLHSQEKQNQAEKIDLHLTIRFGEHREQLLGGSVTFGLKGGELKLKLENGKVPLESIELTDEFQVAVEIQTQQEKSSEKQGGTQIAINPNITAATKEAQKTAKTVKSKAYQVRTKGLEDAPVWVFEVKTGDPVLQGLLKNAKLGILKVTGKPCCVEATFEVSMRDLHLTAEGLWPKDISRNKLAVLERAIVQRVLEPKLKPYLSRVVLQYD